VEDEPVKRVESDGGEGIEKNVWRRFRQIMLNKSRVIPDWTCMKLWYPARLCLRLRLRLLAALQFPVGTHSQLCPAPPLPPLDISSIGSGSGPDTSLPLCLGIKPPLNSLSRSSAPPSPAPGLCSGRNQLSCRRPSEPVRHSRRGSLPICS
jgi:hypothetical protein